MTPTTPPTPTPRPQRGWLLAFAIFALLTVVAYFTLDARVAHWVHDHRLDALMKKWVWVRKLRVIWPGHFLCTLVIAACIATLHRTGLRGALQLLLAGVITASNSILKWIAGRSRPNWKTGQPSFDFTPFRGGIKGLIFQENLAFPSGDVALAVSSAAVLGHLLPRWRPAWWLMAAVVAFQRVAENAHHVSDAFAAAALGVVAFHCARLACKLLPDSREPRGFDVIATPRS